MPVMTLGNINILFIHIPKSGGTSIENAFRKAGFKVSYYDPAGPNKFQSLNYLRRCSPQHMHAKILSETFNIEKFDLIFTVVRNPTDRIKSEYAMRNHPNFSLDSIDFENWFLNTLTRYENNNYIYDNHIRPQSEFIVPGSKIFKLEEGLDVVSDYIAHNININLDFSVIKMDRVKQTGKSSKDVNIGSSSQMVLNSFYKYDFKLFNYI